MLHSAFTFRLFVAFLSIWLTCGRVSSAEEKSPPRKSRDVLPENVAGNEEVERVLKTFPGRGEVGDDSDPTPAEEAVKLFEVADGLKIELVSSEPMVEQPLFMHFDDRGRLWVVQYRQYPFPEGLKVIRYDQHLRAVFDKVPPAPPNHVRGKDKITVYDDTNGDGTYDKHTDVLTGLNIVSAVATGHGGIWVLNPPYLLFYPDVDRDDVPDGDPVVHLSGFGIEDTHSVANSLRWGPDGWLYGANGSTTTGNVSSAVTKNVRWEGQNIWRYHPDLQFFEIFAEGGGNTFSSEIDGKGRVFSGTNHGNTRGMYYTQGSYAEKNWGKHGPLTNPYAFGHFVHMRHEGDQDRFPQTFVIYEGGSLPKTYHGNVIAANALHNRVWASEMFEDTSTYRTIDRPPVVTTPDRWFRPVCVEVGPDGAVYIADWYDTRLTHVDPRDNWHKTSGRIYRLQNDSFEPTGDDPWDPMDLAALSDDELIELFAHPNKFWRQTSVRVLGERLDASFLRQGTSAGVAKPQADKTVLRLLELVNDASDGRSLEALWTLHLAGRFGFDLASQLLSHHDEHMRRWTVRLLGDQRRLNDTLGTQLAELAKTEPYVQVRTQLASSAKRFDTPYSLPIIRELLQRDEDRADLHQPLLLWWALEAHCGDRADPQVGVPLPEAMSPAESRAAVLSLFEDEKFWSLPLVEEIILPRVMQRFVMEDSVAAASDAEAEVGLAPLQACARLLELSPSQDATKLLMNGFLEAYQGREIAGLPESLATGLEEYQQSLGNSDLALALRLGKDDAVESALTVVRDEAADTPLRLSYIEILGQIDKPQVVSPLLGLIASTKSSAVKRAVIQALMNYEDPKIGQTICSRFQSTLPDEHGLRSTAQRVLASRVTWTRQFLEELTSRRIKRDTVPLDIVQQMRLHDDPEVQATLDKLWGKTRSTPEEKQQQIERLRSLVGGMLASSGQSKSDPHHGRELFKKNCGVCHTLFDEGGKTGPNLTGYERTNLDFLLLAIVSRHS